MKRLLFVLTLAGCGDEPKGTRVPLDEEGEASLTPDGATGNGIRPRRRMDLDQLSRAISRVTNGLGWRTWDGGDYYDYYAQTLGQPNYMDLTAEDFSPSLLFQKFLDDGARQVCDQLVAREQAGGADLILTASPDVRENLSALLLRFHGRVVAADSRQIDPWERLYDTSMKTTGDPMTGWRTVCVGLFTHPDFYSY